LIGLLEGGADPRRVCLSDLLETYDSKLFERFRELGVELTAGHELAEALGYHTSNKPLFGYARHHRQDPKIQEELDIALAHHAAEGNAKGVALCLWAGANPHAPVPSLIYPNLTNDEDDPDDGEEPFLGWSAIHEACEAGNVRILERLGLDPFLDDIEALYHSAHSAEVAEVLARFALPRNLGSIIQRQISLSSVASRYSGWLYTLRRLFELGARWEHSTRDEIADVRRYLLRLSDDSFAEAIRLLARGDYCSPTILQDLGRTQGMRARMRRVGFLPSLRDGREGFTRWNPTGSSEVRAKFGILIQKFPRSNSAPPRDRK